MIQRNANQPVISFQKCKSRGRGGRKSHNYLTIERCGVTRTKNSFFEDLQHLRVKGDCTNGTQDDSDRKYEPGTVQPQEEPETRRCRVSAHQEQYPL